MESSAAFRDRLFGGQIWAEVAGTGDTLPKGHLGLINKFARTPMTAEQVYAFPVLAIDDTVTRNGVKYTAESQKMSIRKWVGTTFLFNKEGVGQNLFANADHDLKAASQTARIYKASLVQTPRGTTGTLVWVYAPVGISKEIDEFIGKVDTGIHREVSIHVTVDGAECLVCKTDYPCAEGHFPNQRLENGKTVTIQTKGALGPLELSAVACPGSVVAHIMSDDEVENYQVLSLREALNISTETLEEIMAKHTTTETAEEKATREAAEQKAIADKLALDEAAKKAAKDEEDEAARKAADDEEEAKEKKAAEAAAGGASDAQPGPTGVVTTSAASFKLVEDGVDCPACGRKESAATPADETAAVKEIREKAASVIKECQEKANTAIAAAQADAELGRRILTDLQTECVNLSIKAGIKSENDRAAYSEEVAGLNYSAVKALREALASNVKIETPATRKEKLASDSQERARRLLETEVRETSDGKVTSARRKQGRLAANIGPDAKK